MVNIEKGNVFTGARARFTVGSKVLGYATGCSGSEEIQYEPVNILDNIRVQEYVPVGYVTSLSASHVRLINRGLRSAAAGEIFPKVGGDTDEHLRNILDAAQDMNAIIEDSRTGAIFMLLQEVKTARHSWRIDARGIVGEDVDFVAIVMKDEEEA